VLSGPASDHVERVRDADVVIVDPPRRGLDDALLRALCEHPPSRLIAVSCNPEAFLREARQLLAHGRLRLDAVVAYALFPHTAHVETLACFSRG
jgi:tRNA/tmRNA/rRNA uracil-C5-methylase (TrmA/RlmC/RlmD family)